MANQWYYTRDGEKLGPVSDSDLRKLAADGSLKPDDQIWKEGMDGWRNAGATKGLFTETKKTPPPIPPVPSKATAVDPESPSPQETRSVSFVESAKLVGQLTAKQAELTRIIQVSLLGPYRAIGKHVYQAGTETQQHQSLFQDIDRLNTTVSELEETSDNQPEAKSFTDKAKALGGKAATATRVKTAQLQLGQKLIQLGKAIFESGQTPDICHSEKLEVENLLTRAGELHSEIEAIKSRFPKQGNTPLAPHLRFTSTTTVALFAMCCAPLGLFLIWKHPTWPSSKKAKWTGISLACFFVLMAMSQIGDSNAVKIRSTEHQPSSPGHDPSSKAAQAANTSTNNARQCLHTQEPQLVSSGPKTTDCLTSNFLPSSENLVLEYRYRLLKDNGETDVESIRKAKGMSANEMTVTTTKYGNSTTEEMWFSESPVSVQRGYAKNGKIQAWTLAIVIGACPGDKWVMENGKDSETYFLKSIVTHGEVTSAIITTTSEGIAFGENVKVRREIILREGVGLVEERGFSTIRGVTRPNYENSLLKMNGGTFGN